MAEFQIDADEEVFVTQVFNETEGKWESLWDVDTLGAAKDAIDEFAEENPDLRYRIVRVAAEVVRPIDQSAQQRKVEVRFLEGDDLWLDAEPGWYRGEVDDDGDMVGDTEGPYSSREAAENAA